MSGRFDFLQAIDMLDRHDQLEILALIEGELDASQAAAIRRRLEQEPRAMALIERMQRDRAALRSLDEPELPLDLLSQLESVLARPMLIEPAEPAAQSFAKPGEFRRQHRRQTRRIRWSRAAVAAAVLVAIMAGLWQAARGLLVSPPARSDRDLVAQNDNVQPNASDETIANASRASELTGTVHHYLPGEPPSAMASSASNDSAIGGNARSAPVVDTRLLAADFAVVIQASSQSTAETSLTQVAADLDRPATIVRNFSYAEAKQLAEEWRLAHAREARPSGTPVVAGIGDSASAAASSSELKLLAERVRQRLTVPGATSAFHGANASEASGRIAGPAELAPSLEQQLDFSSRGATLTVAVPASELAAFIEQLSLASGQSSILHMLPVKTGDPSASAHDDNGIKPLAMWLNEGPQIRQSFEQLKKSPPGTIVLVPIVVQVSH